MLRRQLSKWVEGGTPGGAARDPKVTKQVSIILDDTGSNALTAATVNRYEQASQPLNLPSTEIEPEIEPEIPIEIPPIP